MRTRAMVLAACAVLLGTAPALALEGRAYEFRDDFGMESLDGCALNYYYFIPCPTYSWWWGWEFEQGDVVGTWFQIGDNSMSGFSPCDPAACQTLELIRVLDFTGTGPIYCGFMSAEMEVYCADENGCPLGPPLWDSGPLGLQGNSGWIEIPVDPALCLTPCCIDPGQTLSGPNVLVTWTYTDDIHGVCPAFLGTDNIGMSVERGCDMHDYGCLEALFPRPYSSHYAVMHSGYFGKGFEYCPPLRFKDLQDTTEDATQYGYCELAWRIYLGCHGPTVLEKTSWGSIKSIYR